MGRISNNTGSPIIVEVNMGKGIILGDQGFMNIDGNTVIVVNRYGPTEEERKRWVSLMEPDGMIPRMRKRISRAFRLRR